MLRGQGQGLTQTITGHSQMLFEVPYEIHIIVPYHSQDTEAQELQGPMIWPRPNP